MCCQKALHTGAQAIRRDFLSSAMPDDKQLNPDVGEMYNEWVSLMF